MLSKINLILNIVLVIIVVNVTSSIYKYYVNKKEEIVKIENFIKGNKYNLNNDYVAVIEIPTISLKKGLYSYGSPLNNVDINLELVTGTTLPNNNSNTAIMGHSGNSEVSYFKDLSKLKIGDNINFYYNKVKYEFKIADIYLEEKDLNLEVKRDVSKMTLTLITCYLDNYQLVIIAYKEKEFKL